MTQGPVDQLDDDTVVRAALARTADFAPLYERHAMTIYRYCFNQTRDVELANDLTAQVFIRALERLHRYRPTAGATFRSWLFAIARNIVIDHWRGQRPTCPIDGVLDAVHADDPSPEDVAVHRSQMDILLDALDTLPRRYRDIIELRLAGLTVPEIAAALNITESATKSAQTRAYQRLRRVIEPGRGDDQ